MDGEEIALVGAKNVAELDGLQDLINEVWCDFLRRWDAKKSHDRVRFLRVSCHSEL